MKEMNRFFLVLALLFSINAWGQRSATSIVNTFGSNLSDWCKTDQPSFKRRMLEVAGERECLVADEIMCDYAHKNVWGNTEDYLLQQYLLVFSSSAPGLTVEYSNIRVIPQEITTYTKSQNNVTFVACDIKVSGNLNYSVKDLFWVCNGKVVYIDKYKTRKVTAATGETIEKVVIKESMMKKILDSMKKKEFDYYVGGRYGYSSMTPLNLTITMDQGNFGAMFQLGGLFNFSPYKVQEGDVTKTFSEIFYAVIGPSISIPYATFNCGLGAISYKLQEMGLNEYNYTNKSNTQWRFMIKPSLSIDIPISEGDWILSPYVGYNIVPVQKSLNTWEFGIGIRILRD